MTRRVLLAAFAAIPLCADDAQEIWDLFTQLAAALSEGNPAAFLQAFDHSMPEYEVLRADIESLLSQNQVASSIELLTSEGDDGTRTVEVDWFLQATGQQESPNVTRRRERVKCRLMKQKKKWRVTAIEPLSLFVPPKP